MFVDYVEIDVAAGHGGHGCISFHREKFVPKGGPDGGDGGRGGDVIAIVDHNLSTLLDFRYKRVYKAEAGQPGSGALKTGRSGSSIQLRVPPGTLIRDVATGELLGDLDGTELTELIIAQGGKGGHGNTYYKSPTDQAPRKAQDGRRGEKRRISLELKLLADVGLVGLPNAGKSTILASFSAARPKVADYPFTTLVPNLGIVKLREYKSFVMADIPGLIEGASEGKGLGHQFLRHIQRTKLLVYVVDINELDIVATRELLEQELKEFDSELASRRSLTVITKIDTLPESDIADISKLLPSDYIYLSAVSRKGADEFLRAIEANLDQFSTS